MSTKRKPKWTLYYAEIVNPGTMGATVNTGWITRDQLREIARYVKAEFEGDLRDDDPCEDDLWDKYLTMDDDAPALLTEHVFGESPKSALRKGAAIIKACDGSVSGAWGSYGWGNSDDGVFAFGLSREMALNKLDKLNPFRG